MKKIISAGLLGAVVFGGSLNVNACGPYFQPSYMKYETPYSIVLKKDVALRRIIKNMEDLIPDFPEFAQGVDTLNAVIKDFTEAVNKRLGKLSEQERNTLIERYVNFVTEARKNKEKIHEPFELPAELSEFYLYRKGVAELAQEAKDNDVMPAQNIPEAWKKLLELPKEQRHYRTTWVYFMLGNVNKRNPAGYDYHKKCVKAYQDGFADTAGLAQHSYIRGYLWEDDVLSLKWTLYNIKKDPQFAGEFFIGYYTDDVIEKMLQDPLCREILVLFNFENPYFLENMDKYKFRNIDIQAFNAYNKGEFDKAKKYISLLEKTTLLSLWVEAKIARHDGKNDIAVEKLRQWLKMAEKIDPKEYMLDRIDRELEEKDPYDIKLDIYGLLGNALVTKGDFIDAVKFFIDAGQQYEPFYIMDKFMSLDDLIKLAETHNIGHHALFKQAFRESKFDIARKYVPDDLKKIFDTYEKFIKDGNNIKLSGDQRALALYNAAKIMRHHGMELCGYYTLPDNAIYDGSYVGYELGSWTPYAGISCKCKYGSDGYWILCDRHNTDFFRSSYFDFEEKRGEKKKIAKLPGLQAEIDFTKVPEHLRYHYRYRAGKLLLQAGELAKDQDLKAMINHFGGYCMSRSPQEADVFFKRLVKGSDKTAFGQEADYVCWFPKKIILLQEMATSAPCPSVQKIKDMMKEIYGKDAKIAKYPHFIRKFLKRKWHEKKNEDFIAYNLYKRCSERYYPDCEALYKLGRCYEEGRGVAKNPIKAVECYRRAEKHAEAVKALNRLKIKNISAFTDGVEFIYKPWTDESQEQHDEMSFVKDGKVLLNIKAQNSGLCFMQELSVSIRENCVRKVQDLESRRQKGFDFRTILHDFKGNGDFRYLLISDYHTGTSPYGNYVYIIDVKDNFKIVCQIDGGETVDMPYYLDEFIFSQMVLFIGNFNYRFGNAAVYMDINYEKNKNGELILLEKTPLNLEQIIKECKDIHEERQEFKHDYNAAIGILYAALISNGNLKYGPELALKIGYTKEQADKFHAEVLEKIRNSKYSKELAKLNDIKL